MALVCYNTKYLTFEHADDDLSICWIHCVLDPVTSFPLHPSRKIQNPIPGRINLLCSWDDLYEYVKIASPCGFITLISPVIWSLSVAKGVGSVFSEGQNIPSESRWNSSWLMMSGINQMLGGIAGELTEKAREFETDLM